MLPMLAGCNIFQSAW